MRKIIISSIAILALAGVARADMIDDNVTKAEKSVANAQKRLAKAKECQANREQCLADMIEKAQKAADRANDKLDALTADASDAPKAN